MRATKRRWRHSAWPSSCREVEGARVTTVPFRVAESPGCAFWTAGDSDTIDSSISRHYEADLYGANETRHNTSIRSLVFLQIGRECCLSCSPRR